MRCRDSFSRSLTTLQHCLVCLIYLTSRISRALKEGASESVTKTIYPSCFWIQIRNYTDCGCVQSRQVITPSSGGQVNQLQLVIVKTYLNENGYAVSGKCDRTCNTLIPFLVFLFIVTLITACAQPSAIIVTLRYGTRCLTTTILSQVCFCVL